jgi:hypothetical protein
MAQKRATRKTAAADPQAELFERPRVFRRDTLKGRIIRRELTTRFATDALGTIAHGCELYCLTMGKFSLIDVVEHLLATTGPADLVVSTWTAAGADIGFANRLLTDGRIRSLRFVMDYSFPSRQPAYCAALREAFGDEAVRVTKNHAKFVLVHNAEWNLVVRTSMNLNECRRLETVEISDDPAMAGFLGEVIDQLFAQQTAAEAFGRRAGEHCELFGTEWGDAPGTAGLGSSERRFFGDGPADVDLRRVGTSRRS